MQFKCSELASKGGGDSLGRQVRLGQGMSFEVIGKEGRDYERWGRDCGRKDRDCGRWDMGCGRLGRVTLSLW